MLRSSPLVLVALLLGGCTESGTPAPASLPTITNLGLAATRADLEGEGELWLFAARELDSGRRDLDGDGDAFDRVVHIQDLSTGIARNTGLALDPRLPVLRVGDDLALFAASELASGATDLNGDGDTADAVLVVIDRTTRIQTNLGVALALDSAPVARAGLAAFVVSELAQGGRDLDGDGSSGGNVLHLFVAASRELVNTRRAVASPIFLGDDRVAYFRQELGGDLNGDGDPQDRAVLQVYDPATDTNVNTGLETIGLAPLQAAGAWLVGVPESGQGADLNFDGDLDDVILNVFDARRGIVRNSGLSGLSGVALASRLPVGQERFGLLIAEVDGIDHNGDGDLLDRVAFLYSPTTNRLINSRLAAVQIVFVGEALAVLALESAGPSAPSPTGPNPDLNGDGDVLDAVAFGLDPLTGRTTNLRQDALELVGSDEVLVLARPEAGSGVDWNGDGDRDDVVAHVFDPRNGRTTNTALASVGVFGATRREVLLYADEAGERLDLDGDGDRSDAVFVLFDLVQRRGASLGLAGSGPTGFAALTSTGRIILLASERAQGRDLNGDGDLDDEIFHRAE